MVRFRLLVLSVLLFSGTVLADRAPAPVAAPVVPAADEPLRARLRGVFVPAPGIPNQTNLEAGVDRAVNALFLLIRPIARARILEGNPLFPTVEISFPEQRIEVRSPPVYARSLNGGIPWAMIGLDRQRNNVVHQMQPDALVQTCWNNAGRRVTRFVPSPDGNQLTLHIEVTAPQLPVPVRYSLQYVRR